MTKIFVAGKNGQLALSLMALAEEFGFDIQSFEPPELDLTNSDQAYKKVLSEKPDIIINAAAYTAVDAAEENEDLAYAINTHGAEALAKAAATLDVPFLHVSTDYVYPGDKDTPYVESDQTGPSGVYGASKLAGDETVLKVHNKAAVFRTAWVYSPYGKNFVKTMMWLAKNRDEVGIVADQLGNPTYAHDIAWALLTICDKIVGDGWQKNYSGIFHLVGTGSASWYDFAINIFKILSDHGHKVPTHVKALTTEDYPTPAKRPANSQLSTDKLKETFGLALPVWQDSLRDCLYILLKEV